MKKATYIVTSRMILAILAILATVLAAGIAGATDLPAPAPRIWAPAGDLIGTTNHGTLTFQAMDAYGDDAKRGEDWQLGNDQAGSGLLGWHLTSGGGGLYSLRAYGTTEAASGLAGSFLFTGGKPGHADVKIRFRNADHTYDQDSEMRAPGFKADPAPNALDQAPDSCWRMADIGLGYRISDTFKLRFGLDRVCRKGSKASLLRVGAGGDEVPGLKVFDTTRNTFWGDLAYGAGKLAANVRMGVSASDGDRVLDTRRVHEDDHTLVKADLNLRYDVTPTTAAYAGGALSTLKDQGSLNAVTIDGESKTSGGHLGVLTRLGRSTTLRLAASLANQDNDVLYGSNETSRERSRQDLRASIPHTRSNGCRLGLQYRYRASDMDATTTDGADLETLAQEQTRQELVFKGRRRISRKVGIRVQADWRTRETTNDRTWDGTLWYLGMDETKRDQLGFQVALRSRPARGLRLDIGGRYRDRTIERVDLDGVETSWTSTSSYLNGSWLASDRVTVHGTVSYGVDKFELGGTPAPNTGMGALNSEGKTLRFVPGVTLNLMAKLTVDAMYEGVRYQDEGDVSDALDPLESDSDRMLLRASWAAKENIDVTATYRRQEFDENRWDDYIQDLYAISVGGRF